LGDLVGGVVSLAQATRPSAMQAPAKVSDETEDEEINPSRPVFAMSRVLVA
jgi:hypothetical protein